MFSPAPGRCLLIQGYFGAVYNYVGKAHLSKDYWYSKRKLGVFLRFSDIIEVQFGKKCHTTLCISQLFRINVISLSLRNAPLPPSFFLDSSSPYQDLLFRHVVINCSKIFLYQEALSLTISDVKPHSVSQTTQKKARTI